MDALQGYVSRLAKHEDFGRIFEGGGSQFGRKRATVYARGWSKGIRAGEGLAWRRRHIECKRLQVLSSRSSNQQRGRGV